TQILSEVAVKISDIVTMLKNAFLGIIISIYVLGARKQFAAQSKLILHGIFKDKTAGIIEQEVRYADKMFNGFFVGKLIDSTIVGIICFVGCMLMQFDSAALIAVVVGVTNIIPFFGPYLGAIPCTLLLLLDNPVHALMFVGFIIILQQVDGNVLGPIILGDSTGLSGFWIMFAILLFGGLWGLFGMIVGVPLFAVIYDIVRKLVYKGLDKHGYGTMITEYNAEFNPIDEKKAAKEKRKQEKAEKKKNNNSK
ncbi:MAG: AI-2E family transporter, partial [Lachnospiraceae bacterium]|nr:AI-2E family transporter [Lachnospiraceae bacterium]